MPGFYAKCSIKRAILENVFGSNFILNFLNEAPVNHGRIQSLILLQLYLELILSNRCFHYIACVQIFFMKVIFYNLLVETMFGSFRFSIFK